MKKRTWCLGLAPVLLSAGCMSTYPESRCGFEFRVLKPPIVVSAPGVTPVTTAMSSGLVGIDHSTGLASLPAAAEAASMCEGTQQRAAAARYYYSAAPRGVAAGVTNGCTLEELCERMARIEQRLAGPAGPAPIQVHGGGGIALPMPKN